MQYAAKIGITKKTSVQSITQEPSSSPFRPTIRYTENDIDPMEVGAYHVFQVLHLGNDKNIRVLNNNENGKLMFDVGLPILFDSRESI
jgi:hypothetical protein